MCIRDRLLTALKNSIYYGEKDNAILTKSDIETLENNKAEINTILSEIKLTGYPPKGAEVILKYWTRSSSGGDEWVGNKLAIAQYVLGRIK